MEAFAAHAAKAFSIVKTILTTPPSAATLHFDLTSALLESPDRKKRIKNN